MNKRPCRRTFKPTTLHTGCTGQRARGKRVTERKGVILAWNAFKIMNFFYSNWTESAFRGGGSGNNCFKIKWNKTPWLIPIRILQNLTLLNITWNSFSNVFIYILHVLLSFFNLLLQYFSFTKTGYLLSRVYDKVNKARFLRGLFSSPHTPVNNAHFSTPQGMKWNFSYFQN